MFNHGPLGPKSGPWSKRGSWTSPSGVYNPGFAETKAKHLLRLIVDVLGESMSEVPSEGTLTVLFTDLEGSTELRTRVGDEKANEVIRTHEELTRSQAEEFGALDAKALGDGFMIVFSSARKAINAAVAIQRTIEEHNEENPDIPMLVRMGINSGDVTRESDDIYGTAVHAASRVAGKAQGGQILVAEIVKELAGMLPEVRLADWGLHWLKGFPDRWRLYEVLWRDKSKERGPSRATSSISAAEVELEMPRTTSPLIGRSAELAAVRQHLEESGSGGLRAVVIEGEAGIGKTRILEAVSGLADEIESPCWVLSVTGDEELRGPFLLFRTLLGTPTMESMARQARALESLETARDAVGGRGSAREEGLSAQEQMLRVADEVSAALTDLAREHHLALLFDDLQWADEDSIRLIRYLIRTVAPLRIFMLIALRPYSEAGVGGASNLVADLERMHVGRRLRLGRFSRRETAELLESLLEAPAADDTVDSLHSRAEGVPFFIEEFARAYREAGVLQMIDGTWTMTQMTGPAVPASVQSLVARRVAQLNDDCRELLADAAVLGRRFRIEDLEAVIARLDDSHDRADVESGLSQAVTLGIITTLRENAEYDYAFTHDEIRSALVESRPRQRRQQIHGAIVDMFGDTEGIENVGKLAYHALHAGDDQRAVSYALQAGSASLEASAPEEAIHIIDSALPAASSAEDRVELLRLKDDALELLERGAERMANLSELNALTGAVDDPNLGMEVKLRRSSAARMNRDFETAMDLAGSVREQAAQKTEKRLELDACLELGQAIMQCPLGEGFYPLVEVDIEAVEQVFGRSLELARELGDRPIEAAVLRELSVVEVGRLKLMAMEMDVGQMSRQEVEQVGPGFYERAKQLAAESLAIYEDLGDRRGAMTALISMAYGHITDPTPKGMAGRIEHVRKLHNKRSNITEAEQAIDDAHMLYSIHVFARSHANPDLALARGTEAFNAARSLGDRWLEFLAAGGVALTYLSFGAIAEAESWVDRSASAALSAPGPALARRLEMWRGRLAAARGDGAEMRQRFQHAADLALERSSPAGRCEALATLAGEAVKLAALDGNHEMLETAEAAARDTLEQTESLPGRLPWQAKAWGVIALVQHLRDSPDEAAENARNALSLLQPRFNPDEYLDVLWMTAQVLIGQGAAESDDLIKEIHDDLAYIDESSLDNEMMARWFAVPLHRQLAEMSGYERPVERSVTDLPEGLDSQDFEILRLLGTGDTDQEIARRIGSDDETVKRKVAALVDTLGVSDRTEATRYAVQAGIT